MSVYRASGLRVSTQAAGRVEGRLGYAKIAGILLYWAALPRSRQLLNTVMRLDGDDVRYGRIVACWARLSPAELCGFETWYRVNFGPDDSVVRKEMDVPDTEIVDGLPQ